MTAVAEQPRTWVTAAREAETRRAREKAVEQIAGAAAVSYPEATELAAAAVKVIAAELVPGDRRDLTLYRLVAEEGQLLRGLAQAGTRVSNRSVVALHKLTAELADGLVAEHGSPQNLAVGICLRDQLLDLPTEE
jgi:hypothetical protein